MKQPKTTPMNVYCLCKRYYTNKDLINDQFGRLFQLPLQLAQHGNQVTVDAIDYRNKFKTTLNASNVFFSTIPSTFTQLPKLIPRLYSGMRRAKPEIIIGSGDSHIGFLGLQMARRLNVPFVFDVYDYYPVFKGNRIPSMRAMFRSAVKNADLVICPSLSLQKILSQANPNTLLIENGVDRTLFAPGDMQQARTTLGLANDEKSALIGYFGSITPTRGPLLIEACRKLKQTMPRLRLVLAGRVTGTSIDEPWIDYLGELPQQSIPTLIQACDVVSVPYQDDTFNQMSGACKIAEYLACEKPVVATRVSGHEQIFKGTASSLCEPDPVDMARAIRSQLTDPQIASFPESLAWESIGRILHDSLIKLAP
ncbi:glycosyltransferase [Methylomarinum sp. Ch1-1]|uniref:Glycosyltransferase n=1 Tax=Methylomarinum roseum TaxID=3067653 RepID=A0AAU7NQM2_9GAMM|nr:glycosyltransferase [Methylomarinum sp. Ch1-1]MDP4521075.1 glycosyltransferase [Methylomarinum sp. Ch1-1]